MSTLNNFKSYLQIILVILFVQLTVFAQVGQIFTVTEANTLFGQVIVSESLSAQTVQTIREGTQNNIMFTFINGSAVVLGDNRSVLYPAGLTVGDQVVFTKYSLSVFNQLLTIGGEQTISVEQRSGRITITCGSYTMEYGDPCPPDC